jgi:hypothetical protein
MTTSMSSTFLHGVLLGTIMLSAAQGASAMTVTRCNADIGGTGLYQPVLDVVVEGRRQRFVVGEDGLSRRTAFDSKAAVAWVSSRLGLAAQDVGFSDCGAGNDGPEPSRDLVVPDTPPDLGGGDGDGDGGGCGGCGSDSLGGGDATMLGLFDRFATV